METYYTLKFLLRQLRKNGLRCSRPFVMRVEAEGGLPEPKAELIYRLTDVNGTNGARIYTAEEMNRIVEIVKTYPKSRIRRNDVSQTET